MHHRARLIAAAFLPAFLLAGCFALASTAGARQSSPAPRTRAPDFPDPRPIGVVNGHGGLKDHPMGVRPELRAPAPAARVAWIRSELERLYSLGYRRIMFNQLAGHPRKRGAAGDWPTSEQTFIPMAQWHGLDQPFQESLANMLAAWRRDRPDAELGAYLGFKAGPTLSMDLPDAQARFLDMNRPADREILEACVAPWVELGFSFVVFDYASAPEARPYVLPVFEHIRTRFGVKPMGEAMPADGDPLTLEYAWMASSWYMGVTDKDASRRADPAKQELIVAIERFDVTREQIEDWWRRGFTLVCYAGPKFDQWVMETVRKPR